MTLRIRFLFASFLLLATTSAWSHKPSDSYLHLYLNNTSPYGQWDIALRDLEYAIGLDINSDDNITWGELRTQHAAIAEYTLSRLHISSQATSCVLQPLTHLVDTHSDGNYASLRFALDCPGNTSALALEYQLLFDLDPTHRGLLQVESASGVSTAILSPENPRFEFIAGKPQQWQQFTNYWREGVWHIWLGFDHLLFLLALLLPSALVREKNTWHPVESLRPAMLSVVAIVSAFTIAHSITLCVAVLGSINLPSRWIESAIAATIVSVAVNNLFRWLPGQSWLIVFCLGLLHGFGFASALSDLGLPSNARALALLGFNLGVETGQLVIVAGFVPLTYLLRRQTFYQRAVVQLGSIIVATIGVGWLIQRAFDVQLTLF